jgi:hypothetical protein
LRGRTRAAGHAWLSAGICRVPHGRHSPRNGRGGAMPSETPDRMGRCRSQGRMTAEERSTLSTDSSPTMVEMETWTANRGCAAPEPARTAHGSPSESSSKDCPERARKRRFQATPKRSAMWLAGRPRSPPRRCARGPPAGDRSESAVPGDRRVLAAARWDPDSVGASGERADRPPDVAKDSGRLASRGEAPRSQTVRVALSAPMPCPTFSVRCLFSLLTAVRPARTASTRIL